MRKESLVETKEYYLYSIENLNIYIMKQKRKKINYSNFSMLLSVFMLFISCQMASCQRDRKTPKENESTIMRIKHKTNSESTKISYPTVNVYIDNSGSMKGFVNGISEFRDLIHQYITNDIKGSGITTNVNTFFINNSLTSCSIPNSLNSQNLNKPNTDIAKLLEVILKKTGKDTISIFISDCIFSPSKVNPDHYLGQQQILIQNTFNTYKNRLNDVAIIVYQLDANFNNMGKVPYYIWLIGETIQLSNLQNKVPQPKFNKESVKNSFSTLAENKIINYAIIRNSGNFELDRTNPKSNIEKWKRESKGQNQDLAKFSINVDFSGLLLDESYITNPKNYKYDPDFNLIVRKSNSQNLGYTHTLIITSRKVKKGTISIQLKKQIPKWVYESNEDHNSTSLPDKTYGIKYQIQGVYDAFTNQNKIYTEIKINIK